MGNQIRRLLNKTPVITSEKALYGKYGRHLFDSGDTIRTYPSVAWSNYKLDEQGRGTAPDGTKTVIPAIDEDQLIVTPHGNRVNYKGLQVPSQYDMQEHPSDDQGYQLQTSDLFNAMTLGGLHNLSPTQWARRAWDLGETAFGDKSFTEYINDWTFGNNGIVSNKFAREHPYLSAGINMVGDAAILGGKAWMDNRPTTLSVTHRSPKEFDINNFYTGTSKDIGLHVGDAGDSMGDYVYQMNIPKPQVTTLDIGRNNIRHLINDFTFPKGAFVEANPDERILFLKEMLRNSQNRTNTKFPRFQKMADGSWRKTFEKDFHFDLRNRLTSKLSKADKEKFNQEADKLLKLYSNIDRTDSYAQQIFNQEAANLLHKYGIDVVGYNNIIAEEGLKPSYFLTSHDAMMGPRLISAPGRNIVQTEINNSTDIPYPLVMPQGTYNKALGGILSKNSDSTILADNNNYIQDFKGKQYGLPIVRYDNGGHLFDTGDTIYSVPLSQFSVNPRTGRSRNPYTGEYTDVQVLPELIVKGTSAQTKAANAKAINDLLYKNAYDGMTGEKRYEAQKRAQNTALGLQLEKTPEEYSRIANANMNTALTNMFKDPAKDLDKVMLGTLAAGVAPMALPEIVSGATAALANPYVDAALTSYFGAHGINDIANGRANAMTALEVLPMARLAKPLWNAGKSAMQYASETVPEAMTLFNSPLTGKWATFGNKQYRFKPGYIGINGTPMESRPLYSQSTEPEFLESLPIDPERYYRYFDTNALKSYKETGVVSQYNRFGINNSPYPVPMFSKGQPSIYAPKGSVWAISKPESNLQWEAVQGNAVSPLRNGEFNKAPISDFDFYREIPGQGYVKLQEDLSLPKGVTYSETPHIDYLNTLNEQQQIEYLTQNGLNDAWLWTLKNNPSHLESALRNAPIGMPQKSLNKIATGSTAQEASKSQNSASDFDSFFDLSPLYNKSKQIVRAEQEEAIREAEQKVFDYLGSEKHIQRIMEGGKSREEAERIARHMWENSMTAEGELGPLGAAIHGEYNAGLSRIGPWWKGNFKYTLDPKYTINENLLDNAIRRNVFHELGGHGATLSYSPTKSTDPKVQKIYEDVVKEWFPEYKEVYDHNAALKPVRRPQFENAEEVGLEDGMLHYLEDVDEYSARARAENIEPGGDDFGALYRYFTPESLENLKNNVWGTIPLVLGTGLTGYGLYDNFNSTNSDIHAYGGPLVQHANKFIIED